MSVSETGYNRELAAPRPQFVVHQPAEVMPFEPLTAGTEREDAGVSLLGYWHTLVKHRLAIAGVVAGCLALGLAITLLMPAAYTATATIQIDREAPKVVTTEQVEAADVLAGEEYYQTQYGLLRSRSLAERVVNTLGLANNPSFAKGMLSGPSGVLNG